MNHREKYPSEDFQAGYGRNLASSLAAQLMRVAGCCQLLSVAGCLQLLSVAAS